MLYNKCITHLKMVYSQMSKMNKVDGLFVIQFGPLILKTVSPLDPRLLIARRNPAFLFWMVHCGIWIVGFVSLVY